MTVLQRLFEPIKLGTLELSNRIIMPAITTRYELDDEAQWRAFYAVRARGGVGLIIVGALQSIYPSRRQQHPMTASLNSDWQIPRLEKVTEAIHEGGAKAAAQLATYDFWAKSGEGTTPEDIGPSEVEIPRDGLHPRYMTADFLPKVRALAVDEIHLIQAQVICAAERARQAGFDAIEVQIVGGNLVNRFINPFTNRRTDEYGGSIENRVRFACEIVDGIKNKLGKSFPVICRLCGDDMLPWGEGTEYWKQVAVLLEKAGADAITILPGWHETRAARTQMCVPHDRFVHLAAGFKEAVGIPVAAGNNITDPVLAESIIASGKADMVTMGRPLLADPELPVKAKSGRLDEIRTCTRCCYCYECLPRGVLLQCSVNPLLGCESKTVIKPAHGKKKVVVIGGGPAGMQVAVTAAGRGHRVVLFERSVRPGGQLHYAARPPYKDEWLGFLKYLTSQMATLGVQVRTGYDAGADDVVKERPDAVIVATGAVPLVPGIPGAKGGNVVGALEILDGSRKAGNRVVVVGGGSVGLETAEFLAVTGRKVTVLEALPVVGEDVGEHNRWLLIDRLIEAGVKLEPLSPVVEIIERGAWTGINGQRTIFFEADTVVIATGMKPRNSLAQQLEGKVPLLKVVGDCVKPRKVKDAVEEGFLAGMAV
ncbi:MAG: FAD-dependent oxidoreductase [Chloroflexota bacterium]